MQEAWNSYGFETARRAEVGDRACRTDLMSSGRNFIKWAYLAIAFSLRGHFRSGSMSGSTEKATYSLKWTGRVVMHLNEVLCRETRNYKRRPQLLYFMYDVCGMNINMDTRVSLVQREPTVPKEIFFFILNVT
jgi:hypothetical protein